MKKQYKVVPILNEEYKVIVCIDTAKNGFKKLQEYNKKASEKFSIDDFDTRGKAFDFQNSHGQYPFIWIDKDLEYPYATISHEAVHAVEYIFSYIGEKSHDEVFAHSVSAIVRAVEVKQ